VVEKTLYRYKTLNSLSTKSGRPVGETASELREAKDAICSDLEDDRVVVAIPSEPLPLFEASLEVYCLDQMQYDAELVGTDPLVVPELHQMADDARSHLELLVDRLVRPAGNGPRWFYKGEEFKAASPRDLRKKLSQIMGKVYPLTPKLNNEMIVRNKPTPVIVNARKKLVLGILERCGQEGLGIVGNFPDSSMFRTILLNTGIYDKDDDGRWMFWPPERLDDPGLGGVWSEIRDFLSNPDRKVTSLAELFSKLREPPYGLRAGLFPILLAAGLRAFPSAISLSKDGKYIDDILPSVIEEMCKEPERFDTEVLDLDPHKAAYLRSFYSLFADEDEDISHDSDLIRICFDALEAWKLNLPAAALTTKRGSQGTRNLQAVLRRRPDPIPLLFQEIPAALGCPIDELDRMTEAISECRDELMSVVDTYRVRASTSVRAAIATVGATEANSLGELTREWAACFPKEVVEDLSDGMAKGLLSRMTMRYDSDKLLLDSLSSLLLGKSLARWDDSTVGSFDREIQNVVRRVEETALSINYDMEEQSAATKGLADLVNARLGDLYHKLVNLVGPEEASATFRNIPEAQDTIRGENGDHIGRIGKLAG